LGFEVELKKLLTRKEMGTSLPKFSDEGKQWPSFLFAIHRRTTLECQFSEGENMQRLTDCLEGEARKCVEITLLTDDVLSID
jgi:hypothetical protein